MKRRKPPNGFTLTDLLRIELAQHKIATACAAVTLKQAEAEKAEYTYRETVRRLAAEHQLLRAQATARAQEFGQLKAELGRVYGLDMDAIAYDDQTGKITLLKE